MDTIAERQESLDGIVERVTFHSEDSGFCVLRLKVKGHRELQTVVGKVPCVNPGERVECCGTWLNDPQHGLQFKTTSLKVLPPTDLIGMEKYLASGLIKGIGPAYAKRLINAFKEKVFEIIEKTPERLTEVPGISENRQKSIVQAWFVQRKIHEIMLFLHSHGVGSSRAVRIYKAYGDQAIKRIEANPYTLAQDIHGIGFKTADQLAVRLGVAKDAMVRVRAGVQYTLHNEAQDGHCGMTEADLIEKTTVIIEVAPELVQDAINLEAQDEHIIQVARLDGCSYFLSALYFAEKNIARECQRLIQGGTLWSEFDLDEMCRWAEAETQCVLSQSQRTALALALHHKVAIITGGPGVGKTTLVHSILTIILTKKVKVLCTAPTGRAAKRLEQSTGIEAKTIHRLLEFDPFSRRFKRNQDNLLEVDLLVVDEVSMVDVTLMQHLLRALPNKTSVLLVGDLDQLPSVGPGAVLHDLIGSGCIPTARLTEIFRQAASSKIITNAHRINKGLLPVGGKKDDDDLSDFYVIDCDAVEQIQETVIKLVTQRIPQRFSARPIQDIQVLTPTKRGPVGTVALNIELQQRLNPQSETIQRYGQRFGVGDKVVQVVNDYDKVVFNGDLGFISHIDVANERLWIDFDGVNIVYELTELDKIQLAYATTIHKSQGSEYPIVVLPIATSHYTLLERNLLYTGVTRGKQLVILVGQAKAIAIAVNNVRAKRRLTNLREQLLEAMPSDN